LPVTPLILGLILGPNIELQFRRALQISAGDYATLIQTPLSKFLYLTVVIVLLAPTLLKLLQNYRSTVKR
jgi:putative tricarboxylic transport membrane protein